MNSTKCRLIVLIILSVPFIKVGAGVTQLISYFWGDELSELPPFIYNLLTGTTFGIFIGSFLTALAGVKLGFKDKTKTALITLFAYSLFEFMMIYIYQSILNTPYPYK